MSAYLMDDYWSGVAKRTFARRHKHQIARTLTRHAVKQAKAWRRVIDRLYAEASNDGQADRLPAH